MVPTVWYVPWYSSTYTCTNIHYLKNNLKYSCNGDTSTYQGYHIWYHGTRVPAGHWYVPYVHVCPLPIRKLWHNIISTYVRTNVRTYAYIAIPLYQLWQYRYCSIASCCLAIWNTAIWQYGRKLQFFFIFHFSILPVLIWQYGTQYGIRWTTSQKAACTKTQSKLCQVVKPWTASSFILRHLIEVVLKPQQ